MQKDTLFGKTLDELKQISVELELPAYTGGQIAYWLYKTDVTSFAEMTNLSKKVRGLQIGRASCRVRLYI